MRKSKRRGNKWSRGDSVSWSCPSLFRAAFCSHASDWNKNFMSTKGRRGGDKGNSPATSFADICRARPTCVAFVFTSVVPGKTSTTIGFSGTTTGFSIVVLVFLGSVPANLRGYPRDGQRVVNTSADGARRAASGGAGLFRLMGKSYLCRGILISHVQ